MSSQGVYTPEGKMGQEHARGEGYEAWHIMHTVLYKVLNVTNMASGRQAWGYLYNRAQLARRFIPSIISKLLKGNFVL